MSNTHQFLIAGFGGQGVLFSGKIMAYSALLENKEVTWLPSYGPEMRGGTCNCNVIIADEPIGSPICDMPRSLICLNRPSFDKFEKTVEKGGTIIIDSTLVTRGPERSDIKFVPVPATQMCLDNNLGNMTNMILLGKLLKDTNFTSFDNFKAALKKTLPSGREDLYEQNLKAVEMGYNL